MLQELVQWTSQPSTHILLISESCNLSLKWSSHLGLCIPVHKGEFVPMLCLFEGTMLFQIYKGFFCFPVIRVCIFAAEMPCMDGAAALQVTQGSPKLVKGFGVSSVWGTLFKLHFDWTPILVTLHLLKRKGATVAQWIVFLCFPQ